MDFDKKFGPDPYLLVDIQLFWWIFTSWHHKKKDTFKLFYSQGQKVSKLKAEANTLYVLKKKRTWTSLLRTVLYETRLWEMVFKFWAILRKKKIKLSLIRKFKKRLNNVWWVPKKSHRFFYKTVLRYFPV